jgi:ABC-type branched-subunit amino acid transport system ATPase component
MTMLVLEGIEQHFGGVYALRGVTLELNRADLIGLIGPNGAGKSTLVNVASGVFAPSSGVIRLAGKDVTRLPVHRRFELGLGRTFQGLRLFSGLTAIENLIAGMLSHAVSQRESSARAWKLLDSLGLTDDHATLPANLPFGKQKLLSIGRVLIAEPPVVLLDEPFSGLADEEICALTVRLRNLADAGTAVMVIEHNLDALVELVRSLHVLDQGEVVASGAPREVLKLDRVRQAYFGGHQRGDVLAALAPSIRLEAPAHGR